MNVRAPNKAEKITHPDTKNHGLPRPQTNPAAAGGDGGGSMTTKLNADQTVAVDKEYCWQPMSTCPLAVKVQLLGQGGVATYSNYVRGDGFWHGWAPLPRKPKEKT